MRTWCGGILELPQSESSFGGIFWCFVVPYLGFDCYFDCAQYDSSAGHYQLSTIN